MHRPSITLRIALLFGAVCAAGFLALGVYLSSALEMHFAQLDEDTLRATAGRIGQYFESAVDTATPQEGIHQRLDTLIAGHDKVSFWILAADGRPFVAHASVAFPAHRVEDVQRARRTGHSVLFSWEDRGVRFRGLPFDLALGSGETFDAVVAFSIEPHEHFMALFRRAMWFAVFGAIVTASGLGLLIVRRGLRPLRQLTDLAQRVSTERLGERLDTADVPRELEELATAFNAMLSRLDDSFRRLSNFSSDIAHELRTPVSNLLTETQVTLARARSVDEYRDVLASNAEELERLARMVADMLFIAKADNGLVLPNTERVSLQTEIGQLFDFFEALAEDKSVRLTLDGTASVTGDRLMLRRAISNLLSNAIRHTPAGGLVSVTLKADLPGVSIAVSNTGTPIGEEEQSRLFDRFYRTDPSRTRHGEGAGLGLAITKSIVTAHRGTITAEATEQGNTFGIHLPDAPGDATSPRA